MKPFKKGLILVSVLSVLAPSAFSGSESMPSVSVAVPKRVYTISNPSEIDQLKTEQGFGIHAPAVKMMNLMMVRGSGYEGMDMSKMPETASQESRPPPGIQVEFQPPRPLVGQNRMRFSAGPGQKIVSAHVHGHHGHGH